MEVGNNNNRHWEFGPFWANSKGELCIPSDIRKDRTFLSLPLYVSLTQLRSPTAGELMTTQPPEPGNEQES
jgi:hypothetical protein